MEAFKTKVTGRAQGVGPTGKLAINWAKRESHWSLVTAHWSLSLCYNSDKITHNKKTTETAGFIGSRFTNNLLPLKFIGATFEYVFRYTPLTHDIWRFISINKSFPSPLPALLIFCGFLWPRPALLVAWTCRQDVYFVEYRSFDLYFNSPDVCLLSFSSFSAYDFVK